ncbi:hypothetical protein ENSA5_06610 [Enhygromyxa salina]|uniref:Uncharacterized protein n=2 Tax=Enhygromyxa salina TaxID=215803 RepID=A0A2S9YHF3_9BACT|nr:hypothetical protein ENSA5_06610 [Enhygromyxa salina]
MIASFRTVYFRPRLALDWRVPVAALLAVGDTIETVTADLMLDHRCLGGVGARELLRFGVAELASANECVLPSSLGPHFELGPREDLPAGLADPAMWVRSTALPSVKQEPKDAAPSAEKRIPTLAWNHLTNWGVSGYVRKRFQPSSATELQRLPPKVGTVTHFVVGEETILLMEPITFSGDGASDRVASIFQKFSAYEAAWDASAGREHRRVAYVLPGPNVARSAQDLENQLRMVADVYNTGATESRKRFTDEIRRIGSTGPTPELVSQRVT